jgi:hypothetical protein
MGVINERTIINGQEVDLSKEEQAGVTEFHESRIAFAVIPKEDGGYDLAINTRDAREHRVYLREDFGITDELIDTLVRGYIKRGKVMFYVSSYFKPAEREALTAQLIVDLLRIAEEEFGSGKYMVGNGVRIGKPGEEWPPIEVIGSYVLGKR